MEPGSKLTSLDKRIKDVPHIVNADGRYLRCKYWEPNGTPQYLVCVLHGYGEHVSRYDELAGYLNGTGAYVFAHDYVGHGDSEGEGFYLTDYDVLIRDALQHVLLIKSRFPSLPLFVLGHSLGGSVAILLAHRNPHLCKGVIISAGNILPHKDTATPFLHLILNLALKIYPRLTGPRVDRGWLTRDKREIEIMNGDTLLVQHGMMAQTAKTCLNIGERCRSILREVEFPFLLTHGDCDWICDVDGAKMMYEQAKSEDKTLKIYPELRHSLLNELPEDRIINFVNIAQWISQRIA